MTQATADRLTRVESYIEEVKIAPDEKLALRDLIAGARSNDPREALAASIAYQVRQGIHMPQLMTEAVNAHAANCPLSLAGKRGVVIAVLTRPWFWLFASVAIFSPNFPALLAAVRGVAQ